MKKFIFLLATVSSFSAFASQSINCSFTEPFLNIDIDVNARKVVINSPDWENESGGTVSNDISKSVNIVSTLVNGVPTISLYDKKDSSTVLTAKLNYNGSDGMSEHLYAFDAVYAYMGKGSKLYGGCDSKSAPAVSEYDLDENQKVFFKDIKAAVVQCYTRAFSGWTSEASKSEKNLSVFTILYRSDFVPGEPGDVSSTFSSAEGEELTRLANAASPVPHTGGELKAHKTLKLNFCDQYSAYLHSRVQPRTQE